MRLSAISILTTLAALTSAADPKIPCSRSQFGLTFTYWIYGSGNNKAGFTYDVCRRLKTSLSNKSACALHREDICDPQLEGKAIKWTFDVPTICHSGVSLGDVPCSRDLSVNGVTDARIAC